LEEAFGDDRAGIANLLSMACETELRYLAALREAIASTDIRAVASAAHSIKGSASNIGAMRMSRVAAKIEDRARLESWDGIADDAAELDRRYDEVRARVREYAAQAE
jgi:HPt (histidine-containing phosphotransfer) domain-containing protein